MGDEGDAARTVRYTAPLVELYATFDDARAIASLLLVLTDPDRAARAEGDAFKVTVIADDGRRAPASLATAVTLTFLREALGCPMTQASALYARLLGGEAQGRVGRRRARLRQRPAAGQAGRAAARPAREPPAGGHWRAPGRLRARRGRASRSSGPRGSR